MRLRGFRLVGLLLALCAGGAVAADSACRVAFDVGSSGIRAGSADGMATARVEIDYLSPLWAGRTLDETEAPTEQAFAELPGHEQAGCAKVAGGFSAWRLALETQPDDTVRLLARIRDASGVPLYVIPQSVEGAYGYYGAGQQLGKRLKTSHILDIGGGSLQIAGRRQSYGEALGQKVWHRLMCQAMKNQDDHCQLQPMTVDELALARKFADERLQGVRRILPQAVTMTAISRPVTRGVQPAVVRIVGLKTPQRLPKKVLTAAIDKLAPLSEAQTAEVTGAAADRVSRLFSDMLLVEALLRATGGKDLVVAEIDLTNVPGLLADERAFAWSAHYRCYLARLRTQGEAAYASNPASCPAGW
jgi:hypothetical protein